MKEYILLITFIVLDIATGILKGFKNGKLNSTKLRAGLYNKASEIVAVAVAHAIEIGAGYIELGVSLPLKGFVVTYIVITEIVSILENLGEVNPTLDKLFKPYLEKLKERNDENETTGKGD